MNDLEKLNKFERQINEITSVMLSWALILSLAIEPLFRKYGIKAIFTAGFGFGPIPLEQGAALIIATIPMLICVGYMFYIAVEVDKIEKRNK